MKVQSGAYSGMAIKLGTREAYIEKGNLDFLFLNKQSVKSYDIVSRRKRPSLINSIIKGILLWVILVNVTRIFTSNPVIILGIGVAGLLCGILTAKPTCDFTVDIHYIDGENSLIDINEKTYKVIRNAMY